MQYINLGTTSTSISRIVYGCMRIGGDGSVEAHKSAEQVIRSAIDAGITTFDHADIYGGGLGESVFGAVLGKSPGLRDRLVIMTKCGILFENGRSPKHYDLSAAHIIRSVEQSLERLAIEQLDVLMLHRPDYLLRADDVAAAFARLHADGKVAHFGVSNFRPRQLDLLRAKSDRPIVTNQVEVNLHNLSALNDGTLEQCQEYGMTPLAWSPLAGSVYPPDSNHEPVERAQAIGTEIAGQCELYNATPAGIALAWLLCHPAGIVPIIGTTRPDRIGDVIDALDIAYARDDWYRLLEARTGAPVP